MENKDKKDDADVLEDKIFDMDIESFNKALESGDVSLISGDEEEIDTDAGGEKVTEGEGDRETKTKIKSESGRSFTIVHNGKEHVLDEGKMIELAQKGFDYDTKVGPHRRLVQLLDSDPQAQQLLNSHFVRRFSGAPAPVSVDDPNFRPAPAQVPAPAPAPAPDLSSVKLKKLSEFDSEAEWLMDSFQRMNAAVRPAPAPAPSPATLTPPQVRIPSQHQGIQMVVNMVRSHDPLSADRVIPHIDQYADQLTVEEHRKVTSSLPEFLNFYDKVKEQVLGSNPSQDSNSGETFTPKPNNGDDASKGGKKRRFSLKPGGTERPSSGKKGKPINIWELPSDQFNALVDSKIG